MASSAVEWLCDLVRIPSVNPMGRPILGAGDEYYEHRVTDYVEQFCRGLGMVCARQAVAPRRDNFVAQLSGGRDPREGGGLIVLQAHQDTVPVDGMIIPPWTPEIRDGKVFGRGACDIKGGLACHLEVLRRMAARPASERPTLVLACTVNEEHGFTGAIEMARWWNAGQGSPALPARVPDAVIVAEPTELQVVVEHKGVMRWRCLTQGKAAHSSCPERGENAIYRMGRVLAELERYAGQIVGTLGERPLVGRPTLSVGVISGGISVNTVPDFCAIEIDRRVLPGEDPLAARQHVIDELVRRLSSDLRLVHEAPFIAAPGLASGPNAQLAEALGELARPYGGGQAVGVPYGTDAPFFAEFGSPTVVFGPGSIAQAHTCDEWLSIEQLHSAVEILERFVLTRV